MMLFFFSSFHTQRVAARKTPPRSGARTPCETGPWPPEEKRGYPREHGVSSRPPRRQRAKGAVTTDEQQERPPRRRRAVQPHARALQTRGSAARPFKQPRPRGGRAGAGQATPHQRQPRARGANTGCAGRAPRRQHHDEGSHEVRKTDQRPEEEKKEPSTQAWCVIRQCAATAR